VSQPAVEQGEILGLDYAALRAQMALWRAPDYRARQIWNWLYRHHAAGFEEMSNLPAALREMLDRFYRVSPLQAIDSTVSADGLTRKVLFRLRDGETVESVLMAYEQRQTVCVSSQVGCPVGCAFCATGQSGFTRHLTAAEIIAQPLYFARALRNHDLAVTNVVVMGMGEPLLNYDAVWTAVERWNDHEGFDLGARRITISTAGHVPGIERLAQESLQVGLAVSLHAADDALRDQLVPLNRTYPLARLMEACRAYVALTRRRITVEYVLIDDVNDSVAQAEQLARLLDGLLCHVNLIPLNPTPEGDYRPPPADRVGAFYRALVQHGVSTTMRLRRGVDIQAGCGQLRQRHNSPGTTRA
jgi:23S rRNA (adenine2503-C2)-methyltransferase